MPREGKAGEQLPESVARCPSPRSGGLAFLDKEVDPGTQVVAVVMKGAPGNEIAVDDAGFVDEDATANLEIELTFGDGRHPASADASPGRSR